MGEVAIRLGPADNGRRMTLAEFDLAEAEEGYLYELSRGVITVVDVPSALHFDQFDELQKQLQQYRLLMPAQIHRIGGGGECKLLVDSLESERHPDLLIYKHPRESDEHVWSTWVPEIVIEIVSPSSVHRDYEEKPEEYLRFGVREYWIIDRTRGAGEMTALRRRGGRWVEKIVRPPERYQTPLLPGFELDLQAVFRAASAG